MAADEAPLAPITEGSTVEDARMKGSLMIDDDAMTSPGEETDDTSLPIPASDSGTLDGDEDSDHTDINIDEDNCEDEQCPKWSDVLCTPSNAALFTPAADINSLKQNMHGWALKSAYDRTKVLSRTGKNCSQLFSDIANLNEELSNAMLKLLPTLDSAASGTPLDNFSTNVNACLSSFIQLTHEMATSTQVDIVRPCNEYSARLVDEGARVYSRYTDSRLKCHQARKEALKMRKSCEASVKEAQGAARSLRNVRARKSSGDSVATTPPQCMDGLDDEAEISLEEALKRFGSTHGLVKNCDAVASAYADIGVNNDKYVALVKAENKAIADAQQAEKQVLDVAQENEEKRLLYMIGMLECFLKTTQQSLEKMILDVNVEPIQLNLDNSQHEVAAPSTTSLFKKSPRRLRTISDDTGPSINETKLLNLPDEVADLRDTMKSLIGRQSARLKALKQISSFNEGIASALESYAGGIQARLENDGFAGKSDGKKSGPLAAQLRKNEGENMLNGWVIIIKALKANAQFARDSAKQVKGGNAQLYNILLQADKELKALRDGDEFRWKHLNDSAKGETKAKLKHSQLHMDLERAKARLTTLDEDAAESNNGPKINGPPSMNKAMGKMFSILPGGGEHVMNQMLTPQQRQAVVMEQLKEVETKELKAADAAAVAKNTKVQAIQSYISEAQASISKNESDERHTWELMQESLVCAIDALNRLRHGQVDFVGGSIGEIETIAKDLASKDVAIWTRNIEKRIKEKRSRLMPENSENMNDCGSGFSLSVHEIDTSETKKFIEDILSDNTIDDPSDNGESVSPDSLAATNNAATPTETPKSSLPDVPKDVIIGKMDPIFSKKLKGVSIDAYYENGWSDKINPLYSPWLERKGSFDVSVTDWEHSDHGFENKWSGEKFHQKRIVKFKFKRTTHLYIGPPIAGVTQTQYCYKDGDDKCIIMMTVEMDGIPYSDVFAVEVRWAARRVGTDDIAIDAGVFVNFVKTSMFASKIKSGTLTETKPIHLDLFEEIKKALKSDTTAKLGDMDEEVEEAAESEEVVEVEIEQEQVLSQTPLSRATDMFLALPKPAKLLAIGVTSFFIVRLLSRKPDPSIAQLSRQVEDLGREVREMKAMLQSVLDSKCQP